MERRKRKKSICAGQSVFGLYGFLYDALTCTNAPPTLYGSITVPVNRNGHTGHLTVQHSYGRLGAD